MKDRRLINYAVDLLDSESSEDYLSGSRMLDVFIKHQVDVRPLILVSSQKVEKLINTLRWSSSDREIKELAARILAHIACDTDLTQFPGAIRCISSLLGTTTLPYWNNQQASSNQSPQNKLDEQGARDSEGDQQGPSNQSPQSKLDEQGAGDSEGDQQGSSNQSPQSKFDEQGAGGSKGDGWNELILQGLTILERLASDQHNCRDICRTPDLIAKIMSPIYSDTLIQDINIMPARPYQYVVNGAFRVVHRLIRAPKWTGTGTRLAREISCSEQAVSDLERILYQGNKSSKKLQMRAMEILTELALDSSANLALETKENLINKQLQIFLNEGTEEELKGTAGKTLAVNEGTEEELKVTAGKTLAALLSKTGTISVCIMSEYNHIVDQVTETQKKIIYRTIAAEILENLCTLHKMDKNHVKETLLPKVLTEVLTSKKKPPSEEVPWFAGASQIQGLIRVWYRFLFILERSSKASGDVEENPQQEDDEENQRLEHNGQIISSEQNDTHTAMMEMELKEALLSLTLVIFDKLIISGEDFDDVARMVAPGKGEFVAKLKTIVEENCEATANSLRIVKLCGQIAVTMMRCSQYSAHFKEQEFKETLYKASTMMCNLESCMLFAGTDCGAKKTVRPLLSDLVEDINRLVA